jgi:hypothetical protein
MIHRPFRATTAVGSTSCLPKCLLMKENLLDTPGHTQLIRSTLRRAVTHNIHDTSIVSPTSGLGSETLLA